ncbi:MAG TPA: FAD-dependent oxidoreductase, partial [Methylovirgula sp.]
ESGGVIRGVTAQTPEGPLDVMADLVIGADGRHSTVREKAGFVPEDIGAPMDVLWFRLSRKESDGEQALGHMRAGQILVLINRGEHWQCGYVIAKGAAAEMKQHDVDLLRQKVVSMVPQLADRVGEIKSWDDVKLLTVTVDRLPLWHKLGLLCIGDAAHAMSPVGGIGINIAIQDAVATANILTPTLKGEGPISDTLLAEVQKRREWPMTATQALQLFIQNRVISSVLASRNEDLKPPWFFKAFTLFPWLQRIPARVVGLGFRPERVHQGL